MAIINVNVPDAFKEELDRRKAAGESIRQSVLEGLCKQFGWSKGKIPDDDQRKKGSHGHDMRYHDGWGGRPRGRFK